MSTVSIRYMIDDVPVAIKYYKTHLGFALDYDASPAFASVTRDEVRLLLSGKTSSGAGGSGGNAGPGTRSRWLEPDSHPGGEPRSRDQRLRAAGLKFRNEIVTGPGGSQILLDDPSGNPVELFQASQKE
ncbi:MAG: hypothetical protein WD468_03545 [Pirellulales bacterium]